MRKVILILISIYFICAFLHETNAAWYGNTAVSWNATTNTSCPADGDTTGGTAPGYPNDTAVTDLSTNLVPAPASNSYALNSNQTNATTVATTGTMRCLKWDGQAPTNPTSLTLSNVKNSDTTACNLVGGTYYCKTSAISLTYNWNAATDAGGSGIKHYETVFQRASDGSWLLSPVFTTLNGNLSPTGLVNGNTYYTWVRSFDNAGNGAPVHFRGPDVVIDTTAPTASANNTTGVWQNTDISIILSATDVGGISTAKYSWTSAANCTSAGTAYTNGTTIINSTEGIRTLYLCVTDNAGYTGTSSATYYLDKTTPVAGDITNTTPTNLLANSAYSYSLSVVAGGSPITSITAKSENASNQANTTARSSTNGTLTFSWDMRDVDVVSPSYRQTNGSRQYTVNVTQICDTAGNCGNMTYSKNHDVYADIPSTVTSTINSTPLTTGNIADGTTRNLSITLKDQYNNIIIPASGISRTIDFNWGVTNTMYLNQYTRSGDKSVFVNNTNTPATFTNALNGNASFNGEISTDGIYTYGFKFYTPTANQTNGPVSDTSANFSIDSLSVDLNGSLGSTTSILTSTITAKFNPLYSTAITGELKDGGFVEGATQSSNIAITNNGTITPTGLTTYIRFGDSTTRYDLKYSTAGNPTNPVTESATTPTLFSTANSSIYTLLSLITPPAPSNPNAYLSTHIGYTLDTHVIIYNSDIIGKGSYFGGYNTNPSITQNGVKIIGNARSGNSNAIVDNQIPNDVKILGDSNKFISKTAIIKNGFTFAKNTIGYTGATSMTNIDTPNIGTDRNGIIYLGAENGNTPGKKYQLGVGSNIGISTNKTILVIGANLYIKSNLYYSSNNGMLGIVVLKDNAGNGGNVYIDPSVTNLVGSIFAEKSIISYDGTNELDGNTPVSTLKNQLHIYGNIFSENTIGGSRATTPKCPYYVPSASCATKEQAQKYDLNYLRRYYLIDASLIGGTAGKLIPAGGSSTKIIGGGTCSNTTGVCTGGNTSFARNITNTNQSYSANSTLIEYNSRTQSTPPSLFKTSN